ncbi:tetratricopeptide repeat protein [Glaesserella sp.]|uniref:tetratricopeptide repeat protein n=1 Tax=Glaesserella sp. TaxID=2094731 RepID=UPI0035A0EFE2
MHFKALLMISTLLFFYPAVAETTDAEFERQNETAKAAMLSDDFATALKIWQPYADRGNKRAQNNLGMMYLDGLGVEKDWDKAKALFEQSAAQGLPQAQYQLGLMLFFGKNGLSYGRDADHKPVLDEQTRSNMDKALKLFEQSAEQGFPLAQRELADMYYLGEPTFPTSDKAKALYWYEKAAEQKEPISMGMAASLLLEGDGVARNCEKGLDWLNKAMEADDFESHLVMARMYQKGHACVKADPKKAQEAMRKIDQLQQKQ